MSHNHTEPGLSSVLQLSQAILSASNVEKVPETACPDVEFHQLRTHVKG